MNGARATICLLVELSSRLPIGSSATALAGPCGSMRGECVMNPTVERDGVLPNKRLKLTAHVD